MNRLEAAEAGYHSMRDMIVQINETAGAPAPVAESQAPSDDLVARKIANAERAINADIAKLRTAKEVPASFREDTADVDALLASFPPIPDVWFGQDADPAEDNPDGPWNTWVTTGIIVHLAGSAIQLRPDVRTLEDVKNVAEIFRKTAVAESHARPGAAPLAEATGREMSDETHALSGKALEAIKTAMLDRGLPYPWQLTSEVTADGGLKVTLEYPKRLWKSHDWECVD